MTESQLVLIVTFSSDAHLPFVTKHLDRIGQAWELLTTDLIGEKTNISIEYSHNKSIDVQYITDSGSVISPSQVGCVWNRRRIVAPMSVETGTGDRLGDQYIREQKLSFLENGLSFIQSDWINRSSALALAKPKLQQLSRAIEHGLKIPRTLCSCTPEEVRAFATTSLDGIITKVVSPGTPLVDSYDKQYMVFTQEFNQSEVSDAQIISAPAIYQQKIIKKYEARIIIVGDAFFACKIDSQASEMTQLDWRHYDFDHVVHEQMNVPDQVKESLMALVKSYGLIFAAVDMAVTADNEWIFYEINPNGQWAWLEEFAGLPIGQAMANELSIRSDSNSKQL